MNKLPDIVAGLLNGILRNSMTMPLSIECILKFSEDEELLKLDNDHVFQSHLQSAIRASKELSSYIEYAIKHIEENS